MKLAIKGEYPPDWNEIGDRVCAEAGHRCIRCGHPYRKGAHGNGHWTPCDEHCTHGGPIALVCYSTGATFPIDLGDVSVAETVRSCHAAGVCGPDAEWRILTVHHLDGDKSNCAWWNLLALCQRCHLQVQGRVNPQLPYFLEHSEWFRPYVAGFYAHKYEGRAITRAEALAQMDRLLAYERLA